jgi:hypothetical protein
VLTGMDRYASLHALIIVVLASFLSIFLYYCFAFAYVVGFLVLSSLSLLLFTLSP